jgi:hypothetical protein
MPGLFLIFVVLSFSTQILDFAHDPTGRSAVEWLQGPFPRPLLTMDSAALAVLLGLVLWRWSDLVGARVWAVSAWTAGAASTIALDCWNPQPTDLESSFLAAAGYFLSLVLLYAGLVGASPRLLGRRSWDPGSGRPAADRMLVAVPLFVATLVAYAGALTWENTDLRYGGMNPQYFAQLSQVLPLLLVALGVEARVFERTLREAVQRSVTVFTIAVVSLGELLVLAVLPLRQRAVYDNTIDGSWFVYLAFLVSILAISVAVATLLQALVTQKPATRERPAPPAATDPPARSVPPRRPTPPSRARPPCPASRPGLAAFGVTAAVAVAVVVLSRARTRERAGGDSPGR